MTTNAQNSAAGSLNFSQESTGLPAAACLPEPCCSCGRNPVVREGEVMASVRCLNPSCRGRPSTYAVTIPAAVTAWNKYATERAQAKLIPEAGK